MSVPRNDSSSNLLLVNYGEEDSDADSEEEGEVVEKMTEDETEEKEDSLHLADVLDQAEPSPQPPIAALKEDEEIQDILTDLPSEDFKAPDVKEGEVGTIADISEDEDDVTHKRRPSESMSLRDSFTSEPETALTQKIRRLSADQVTLPPEPRGRCSKKLQEKIGRYYRKNINMNASIQNRKDFRNPSIYEKLISYLGIDELGTNYPKDVFNPHGWDEGSYYESLAKAQKEEMAKREKEKKERTKVEFVSGVVKKPKPSDQQALLPDEERKRKSKWDAPAPNPSISLLGRPQVAIITTSITNPMVVSTTVSATGAKTKVISAIGTIKKPKMEKMDK